jgi:hypothetical protein
MRAVLARTSTTVVVPCVHGVGNAGLEGGQVVVWWLAGAMASQGPATSSGRLFLHLQTDRAVDVPWDQVVADQAWLDALGLRAVAPLLRQGAEALRDAEIGEQRQVAVAGGTAMLEMRPDARIATWLDDLAEPPAPLGEPAAAPVVTGDPE